MDTAAERYEARFAKIDNYTVVQDMNGTKVTTYFEKRMQDGHPVFDPRVIGMGNLPQMPGGDRYQRLRSGGSLAQFADRAKLTGTETVDGHKTWVLQVDDLSGLGLDESQDFKPGSMTIYLGQDDYVPHQMKVSGRFTRNGESHPVDMTMHMQDYREVKGLLYPYRTTVSMEGMMEAMSTDERGDMSQQMEEMKKRLEQMTPEQRAMFEQQMKNMPGMRAMMEQLESASAGGAFEMSFQVDEVRVNEGPPSGL